MSRSHETVEILLEQVFTNPASYRPILNEKIFDNGYTALQYCSQKGLKDLVAELLGHAVVPVTGNKLNEVLFIAARARQYHCVDQLLMYCPKINALDDKGTSLLMHACRQGELKAVVMLIERYGAGPIGMEYLSKVLFIAAKAKHYHCVDLLLKLHRDSINELDKQGKSLLMHAVVRGELKVISMLIDHGADPYEALFIAARVRQYHCVDQLLMYCPDNINVLDAKGTSLLMHACRQGELKAVVMLIERYGAGPIGMEYLSKVLLVAAKAKHYHCVDLLLKLHRDSINVLDDEGKSLLMHAADQGELKAVVMLIERYGAGPIGMEYLSKVLFIAAKAKHYHCVDLLLKLHRDSINELDKQGKSLLMHAAARGDLKVISMLIDHGADPLLRNNDGEMVMHVAVKEQKIDVIKLLHTKYGVSLNTFNKEGFTLASMVVFGLALDRWTLPGSSFETKSCFNEHAAILKALGKLGVNFDLAPEDFELLYESCRTVGERNKVLREWGFSCFEDSVLKDGKYRRVTPIKLAYQLKKYNYILLLVELGASINQARDGKTLLGEILEVVYFSDKLEQIVMKLFDFGLKSVDHEMVLAAKSGHYRILNKLLMPLESVSRCLEDEDRALYELMANLGYVGSSDQPDLLVVIRELSARQLNINRLFDGQTLMHLCVKPLQEEEGSSKKFVLKVIGVLTEAGASWFTENTSGISPYQLAGKCCYWNNFVRDVVNPAMFNGIGRDGAITRWASRELRFKNKNNPDLQAYGEVLAIIAINNQDADSLSWLFKIGMHRSDLWIKLAYDNNADECLKLLAEDSHDISALVNEQKQGLSFARKKLNDKSVSRWDGSQFQMITILDLSFNKLTHKGVGAIASLSNLKQLVLSHNAICLTPWKKNDQKTAEERDYLNAFILLLGNESSLERLDLSANKIDQKSAMQIAESLRFNKKLLTLNLSGNYITPGFHFFKKLAKSTQINPGLKKRMAINISGNFLSERSSGLEIHRDSVPKLIMNARVMKSAVYPMIEVKGNISYPVLSTNVWLVYYMSRDYLVMNVKDHATMLIEGMRADGQRVIYKIDASKAGDAKEIEKKCKSKEVCTEAYRSFEVGELHVGVNYVLPKNMYKIRRSYPRFLVWARNRIEAKSILNEIDLFVRDKKDVAEYAITGSGDSYNCAKFLAEMAEPANISISLNAVNSPSGANADDAMLSKSVLRK